MNDEVCKCGYRLDYHKDGICPQDRRKTNEVCFDDWLEQFKELEDWHEELLEEEYILWEAFQAGWDAFENLIRSNTQTLKDFFKEEKEKEK